MWRRVRLVSLAAILMGMLGAGAVAVAASGSDPGPVNATVYKANRNVNVTGTVDGDVFCAGQTVNIDATVNGDVICAGQTVNVSGKVNGSVRVAGQSVQISADVSRAVSVAGQDVTINSDAKIGRDLSIVTQTATVNGKVGRDLSGSFNDLLLSNTVGRNVDAIVNRLELQDHAVVAGNLTYHAERRDALKVDSGAAIHGRQTYQNSPAQNRATTWSRFAWIPRLYLEVSLIIFALVLAALFPQLFDNWNQVARRRFGLSLLIGFLAMFVVPAIIVALFASIIGLPLALLTTLAWLVIVGLSAPVAAYYIGSLILNGGRSIPLVMLIGAAILAILCLIPIVGWAITIVAYWFGTGALLLNLRGSFARPDYHTAPEHD